MAGRSDAVNAPVKQEKEIEMEIDENSKREDSETRVKRWLEENVTVIGDVKSVVLSKFTWNPDFYQGHFYVAFDGVEYPESFFFSLGGSDGHTNLSIPNFQPPGGIPAVFEAINMPENVARAIEEEIRILFPRISPYGLNRETNKETVAGTPIRERLPDPDAFLKTVEAITDPDFEIQINLDTAS